jgi:hypothetical protein
MVSKYHRKSPGGDNVKGVMMTKAVRGSTRRKTAIAKLAEGDRKNVGKSKLWKMAEQEAKQDRSTNAAEQRRRLSDLRATYAQCVATIQRDGVLVTTARGIVKHPAATLMLSTASAMLAIERELAMLLAGGFGDGDDDSLEMLIAMGDYPDDDGTKQH